MSLIRDIINYEISKDYLRLYELAKIQSVVCTVENQEKFTDETIHVCRDIAHTIGYGEGDKRITQIGVRGISYVWADGKWDFVKQCEKLKVEWIIPHHIDKNELISDHDFQDVSV